jgi:hypothetical protein|tara:strand:- start:500 stop:1222 length:723 start_codon:yes stop_codon:yes gene_type:complete
MSDMKLIMENWREYQLNEISGSDPVTYGLLKSILKLMTGAKQGLAGDALATASGIFDFIKGGDAGEIVGFISGMFEGQEEEAPLLTEELLNEFVLTVGAVLLGMKALGAVSTGVKLVGLGKKLYSKLKGEPTEKTDKLPFLDLFNLDPEYSAIVDDRIEEEFLQWWLTELEGQGDEEEVASEDLDVNANLIKFLNSKYGRQLAGHTAPGVAGGGTTADMKSVKKAALKKRATGGVGKQLE